MNASHTLSLCVCNWFKLGTTRAGQPSVYEGGVVWQVLPEPFGDLSLVPQVFGDNDIAAIKLDRMGPTTKSSVNRIVIRVDDEVVAVNTCYSVTFIKVAVSSPVNFLPPEVTVKAKLQPL